MTNPSQKRGYTVEEAAQSMGLSRSLVYVELKKGRLKSRKCGRRTVIMADAIDDWSNSLPENPAYKLKTAS